MLANALGVCVLSDALLAWMPSHSLGAITRGLHKWMLMSTALELNPDDVRVGQRVVVHSKGLLTLDTVFDRAPRILLIQHLLRGTSVEGLPVSQVLERGLFDAIGAEGVLKRSLFCSSQAYLIGGLSLIWACAQAFRTLRHLNCVASTLALISITDVCDRVRSHLGLECKA